jgi:hypothetical protein
MVPSYIPMPKGNSEILELYARVQDPRRDVPASQLRPKLGIQIAPGFWDTESEGDS